MSELRTLVDRAARAALPRLTEAESAVVRRELDELERGDYSGPLTESLRKLAAAVPERPHEDSARVLLRMHEIAGSGNYQSNLSSLAIVRACFELGLAPEDGPGAGAGAGTAVTPTGTGPAELIVGRGHIAPAFYAEHHVRGTFPFAPLATLHQGGLTGVIHRELGFTNTMRYSLGVGVAQAVSLAFELARRGEDRKVVCLSGDGELQEGVAFECLRFAHEAGLANLILVVDTNGKGIEPLPEPLSRDYLASYLGRVEETDGLDTAAVRGSLGELLAGPTSAALVCRTRKGDHSFKPTTSAASATAPKPARAPDPARGPDPAPAPAKVSFATTSGAVLAAHRERTGREPAVFTADMAARFGLRGHVPYTNTGLAETLSLGLTLALPEDTLKVVATDAMYYMDSLSMLTEATTSVRRLLVLAGRSWGAWGGAHNATNLLGRILHTRVYEPVTKAEYAACVERLEQHPDVTHVVSAVDAKFDPPAFDCSAGLDGGVWVTPPGPGQPERAVVTFGYASVLVAEANREAGIPHLHCAALDPEFDSATLALLAGCRRLLTVEYNGVDGGFGERLRAKYLLPARVHGVRRDIANCVHAEQLRRHGMSPDQLRDLLGGFAQAPADDAPGEGARAAAYA
ncbi:1-deoxy-D-xylulose-5-phosphate synthase N-terminal domain-containing protein [Streptomyces sp. HNM0574]|uniref:1-deoxy-D-xylulose-5-phosphate synthase N-terminal domain-containing protein n=1 Tax=Streptomyces sp. HNM0574 TaxID=2714954 RepID=UPI001469AB68|nr:1-deoxy-D-xylulose-5-phosphate synthase N-terminal domain-containing protein [Streptomyces sp. HNM0574]NLU70579.1 transketolase [Streptomyces sp. HNM0574]